MGRTDHSVARPGFIADADSIARNTGRQVNWDRVPDSFKNDDGNKFIQGSTVMSELGNGQIVPRSTTKVAITNLTETAETATATATGHGYETGDIVTISGAAESNYNGTWEITVTGDDAFTFDVGATTADDGGGATAVIEAKSILFTNAVENSKSAAINGQGVILGGVIFETLMHDLIEEDADFETYKAELKAAGTGFVFETYSDDRSS